MTSPFETPQYIGAPPAESGAVSFGPPTAFTPVSSPTYQWTQRTGFRGRAQQQPPPVTDVQRHFEETLQRAAQRARQPQQVTSPSGLQVPQVEQRRPSQRRRPSYFGQTPLGMPTRERNVQQPSPDINQEQFAGMKLPKLKVVGPTMPVHGAGIGALKTAMEYEQLRKSVTGAFPGMSPEALKSRRVRRYKGPVLGPLTGPSKRKQKLAKALSVIEAENVPRPSPHHGKLGEHLKTATGAR